MSFSHDRRGQSVVVGTVILFGFLILALASYQAFAVPAQNNAAEFEHSQDVQSDMQDLRASLLDIRDASQNPYQRPVRVGIGFRYDTRLFAVNPAPPEGALTTQNRGNLSISGANVVNGQEFDNTGPLFDREHTTRLLTYRPNYNEYRNPPRTTFEHSLLYNRFEGFNRTITGQQTIDGDIDGENQQLSLIAYSGEINRQGLSTTLDPETVDGPTPRIPITGQNGDPFNVTLPTHSPSLWTELIGNTTETGEPNARVVDNTTQSVTVELEGEWDLRMTRVGYDSGSVTETPFSNVTTDRQIGGGGLNRTYNVTWDEPVDPLSDGDEISGTVRGDDELLDNATVDFATANASILIFQGEDTSKTTVDGVFTTTVTTTGDGSVTLFAASGDDVDRATVAVATLQLEIDILSATHNQPGQNPNIHEVDVTFEATDDRPFTNSDYTVTIFDQDQTEQLDQQTGPYGGGEVSVSYTTSANEPGPPFSVVVQVNNDGRTASSNKETTQE